MEVQLPAGRNTTTAALMECATLSESGSHIT